MFQTKNQIDLAAVFVGLLAMYVPLCADVVVGVGTTVGDVEGASDNGQDGATVTIMGAADGLADGMSGGMLVVSASEEVRSTELPTACAIDPVMAKRWSSAR